MPLVSVIVPAHDSEAYVGSCLDSVAAQDFRDFELIVVDDGSRDATADVVRERCQGRVDYKLLRQHNRGPGHARNRGIRESTGQYVLFLDSDDALAPNALSTCVSHLTTHSLDAVLFEGRVVEIDGIALKNKRFSAGRPPHLRDVVVAGQELFTESLACDAYIDSAVMYMTRRDALDGTFFPEGHLYEDSVFTTRLLLSGNLQRIMCISDQLYERRSRRGSITSSPVRPLNYTSLIRVYETLARVARSLGPGPVRSSLAHYRRVFLKEAIACSNTIPIPFLERARVACLVLADRELPTRAPMCLQCLQGYPARTQE